MTGGKEYVGIILSEGTTSEAKCQLFESAERGGVREGMLLLIESNGRKILARVAEITPYNDFYTEGDSWSEARRKGYPIPENVARRYEICKLDLLMEVPRGDIRSPPQPGDLVLKIDPRNHRKAIFGVSQEDPKYIWFGSLLGYEDAPVSIFVENIPMHIAIFGVTGSGKSFTTGALIEKLADIPVKKNSSVSYPMIIIDAHGDYLDYVDYVANGGKLGQIGWIRRYVFPKTSYELYLRQSKLIRPIGINLDLMSPREVAETIVLFYKGTTEGAELQIDAICKLFERMKEEYKVKSIQDLFIDDDYFKSLLQELEKMEDVHPSTKGAVRRALDSFRVIETEHNLLHTDSDLKKEEFVDDITKKGGIAIIDFSAEGAPGVDLKTKQLVMTYLASLLFEQFTNYKMRREDRYLLLIIEEAQNFCPDKTYPISSSLAHAKLSAIATQGRKFGLSLCLISQRPSFVDRIVLSMCNSFLIHRISPEDISFVRNITGLPSSLASKLTTMRRGDLILTGQISTMPFPLLIHVSGRQVKHTVGETKVCENLAKLRGLSL